MIKPIYRNYLFAKNILVGVTDEGNLSEADERFYSLFTIASKFNIKITKGDKYVNKQVIEYLMEQIPDKVTPAFYRGFPESVRRLTPEQLLLDQLVHYYQTYGTYEEGQVFEGDAAASLFEENFDRIAFRESTTIKEFQVITEEMVQKYIHNYVCDLCTSSRPLSQGAYDLVKEYLTDCNMISNIEIASKDTAIKLLLDIKNVRLTKFIELSDIIKVVEEILHRDYPKMKINKLNLKNSDRKFISGMLDLKLASNYKGRLWYQFSMCFEKRNTWKGLLHHIHYMPKGENGKQFVDLIRNSEENISVMSSFEKQMNKGNPAEAAKSLVSSKGNGALLRSLNYVLSRCKSKSEVQEVINQVKADNPVLLLQLIVQYKNYIEDRSARTFTFTKNYKLKCHRETISEKDSRKSFVTESVRNYVVDALWDLVKDVYKNKLGKVYIDESMKDLAVPMQETTAETGYGILPKGTRIAIPEGKIVRAFTYWEKVNDIDLSCFGITAEGKEIEFSWRTMYNNQSQAVTFSGDQTRGYNGGSEYYDIDFEAVKAKYPSMKYIIFCNNVYTSGVKFNQCTCRAGYMVREKKGSGEIWEPKTVESSYTITGDSTYSYMFALDMEKRCFVWLNMTKDSMSSIAGGHNFTFLAKYINMTDILNVYKLFEMMATEIVTEKELADVIVSDETIELQEHQIQVRSTDTEVLLKYLNNK